MSADALVRAAEEARAALIAYLRPMEWGEAHKAIGDGRWSPVEYLEHLVRAEEATVWRMFKAVEDERRGEVGPRSDTPGTP